MLLDAIIIGAGTAGITAAIQLTRSQMNICLLEKQHIGGLLHSAMLIENFPGFPNGIKGKDLACQMEKQLEKLKISYILEPATYIYSDKNSFTVKTTNSTISAKYLIMATGTIPLPIPIQFPEAATSLIHNNIESLLDHKGENIAIVGAGDAAFDYALNLSQNNNATLLCRSLPCCLPLLYQRADTKHNIKIINNVELNEIKKEKNQLELIIRKDNETGKLNSDHILFAIGRKPNIDLLKTSLTENEIELFIKNRRIHLVGDIKNNLLRQAVIAAGDGMRAAMEIIFNENSCDNRKC